MSADSNCAPRVALFQELKRLFCLPDEEQKKDEFATAFADAINNSGLDQETVAKIVAQATKVSIDIEQPDLVGDFAKIKNPTDEQINAFYESLKAQPE
jgi:hypothetical protein